MPLARIEDSIPIPAGMLVNVCVYAYISNQSCFLASKNAIFITRRTLVDIHTYVQVCLLMCMCMRTYVMPAPFALSKRRGYACTYVRIYIYIYIYIYIGTPLSCNSEDLQPPHTYMCMYVCVCVYVHTCTHTHTLTFIVIYMVHMCIHTYIIYANTQYIHTYIHSFCHESNKAH